VLSRVIVKKRRGRRAFTALAAISVVIGSLLLGSAALAVNATGAFELDGNAVNQAAAGDDWDNVCHQAAPTECPTGSNTTGATAVSFIDTTANPIIFTTGGSKDPEDPQDSWLWKPSDTIPDKDTILHAFAAKYSLTPSATTCPVPAGTTSCDVIFFGSDRFTNDGDAQLGFWFFKNAVTRNDPGATTGTHGFTGHHADGDLLVISDFSNGGTTSTIKVYFWDHLCGSDNTAANKIYQNAAVNQCGANNLRLKLSSEFANCGTSAATAAACGIVNPHLATDAAHETAPWPFVDKKGNDGIYDQGELYEAGINLSALGLGGTCFSSFEAESRASTAPTATLKALAIGGFGACTSGLVTTPSPGKNGSVAIGSNGTVSVTDSAALNITGAASWTGTLKFFFCGPLSSGSCDGTTNVGVQVGSDRTVTNATAQPFVSDAKVISAANAAGEYYCWRATFTSGTTGVPNASDGSSTECFTVTPLTPTITTQLKKVSDDSNASTITLGTAVYDTAALSGNTTTAGGTVRYRVYTNSTCTTLLGGTDGNAYNTQADVTVTNGSVPNSANITLLLAGTYYFQATYQTGDANNVAGAKSACTSETLIVQATPAPHSAPEVQIRDSVTVTGLSASPTGNLVIGVYSESTCTTRVAGTSDKTVAITSAQPVVTDWLVAAEGDYFFKVSYAGDANNVQFSNCDEHVGISDITALP
jgi:hypothetical protein